MGSSRAWWSLFALFGLAVGERTATPRALDEVVSSAPAVLETDARAMEALEADGLSLSQIFGAHGPHNDALAATDAWSTLLMTLEPDLDQLAARPGIAELLPRQRFQSAWLRDPRAHFELVGAVNRLDRAFLDPAACGEARLVYRLVLQREGRPPTSLPMTVSVVFPQPMTSSGPLGTPSCAATAQAWLDLPPRGAARVHALAALFRRLPDYVKVEINLQSFHAHATAEMYEDGTGHDDHAEYLLRSFDRVGDALVPRLLVDTPRVDLDDDAKRALAAWVSANFDAIDRGSWVVPDRFLATRALSVTPRGFARGPNRAFASLFGDGSAYFKDLPYGKARLVKSTAGLLRRLDQGTCQGCHETRSVAGFHLLGEARTPETGLDASAVARSAHLDVELGWREAMTTAVAHGARFDLPRPFAERKRPGPGRSGAHCALNDDPTFAGWTCAPGLACHASDQDDVGACVRVTPRGVGVGEACEDVALGPESPATGAPIDPRPIAPCAFASPDSSTAGCDPNLLGFPSGMCVADCSAPGAAASDGELTCGVLPSAGYENDCFMTTEEPIEKCIGRYLRNYLVRTCSEDRACRDDYACARMTGLPRGTGICVPTYFVYGLRVDGPLLDR